MRSASVFVLSSLWEGFPNVLVQAMACNTQIISTNCPSGPSEILANGRYGTLIPNNDIDSLASASSVYFVPFFFSLFRPFVGFFFSHYM